MAVRDARDPWRALWQIATGGLTIALLLALVGAMLLAAALLPQVTADDPVLRARQQFQAQARLGSAASTLQTLGLFSLARSAVLRVALALLAVCLALRLVEGAEMAWRARSAEPFRQRLGAALNLLAHAGALLVLLGLLAGRVWGWRLERVVVQAGQRVSLGHDAAWVALDPAAVRLSHSPGLVTHTEERGPGIRVRATDSAGAPLPMLQTPEAQPEVELLLPLREDAAGATRAVQFAIPQVGLVVRIVSRGSGDHPWPLRVQAYRSPSGELTSERWIVAGQAEAQIGEARIEITEAPYRLLTVAYSPGRWAALVGLGLLMLGLVGTILGEWRREGAPTGTGRALPQPTPDGAEGC